MSDWTSVATASTAASIVATPAAEPETTSREDA
jgi:hypothetical protein